MGKLMLVVYGFSLLVTIVLFMVFSYLMTTVNPDRIQVSDEDGTESNITESTTATTLEEDTTDSTTTKEDTTVATAEEDANTESDNENMEQYRHRKILKSAQNGIKSLRLSTEVNGTSINGTSPQKSSKSRRSIQELRTKKKKGTVLMRIVGEDDKPRIEIVFYPKRSQGKNRRNYYIRNNFDNDLKYKELIDNPIINILHDDTAILENLKLENFKSGKTSEKTLENTKTFGMKNTWINLINASGDFHRFTKLNTNFSSETIKSDTLFERTAPQTILSTLLLYNYTTSAIITDQSEDLKVTTDVIDDQPEHSVTKLNTLLFPAIAKNTLEENTLATEKNENYTDSSTKEEVESDKISEVNTQSFLDTIKPEYEIASSSQEDEMTDEKSTKKDSENPENENRSIEATHIEVNETKEITESNETSMAENASGDPIHAIENIENNTNYNKEEEIESKKIVEDNTQRSEIDIMSDKTGNDSFNPKVANTSIHSTHIDVNETPEIPESNEHATIENASEEISSTIEDTENSKNDSKMDEIESERTVT